MTPTTTVWGEKYTASDKMSSCFQQIELKYNVCLFASIFQISCALLWNMYIVFVLLLMLQQAIFFQFSVHWDTIHFSSDLNLIHNGIDGGRIVVDFARGQEETTLDKLNIYNSNPETET